MTEEPATEEQTNTLHAACGDLAEQIEWHGFKLTKDEFRHFICGTILGWKMLPGIDRGEGPPGFIMLGGSIKDLAKSKSDTSEALELAFHIGDHPEEQGLKSPPVRWCKSVVGARFIETGYE